MPGEASASPRAEHAAYATEHHFRVKVRGSRPLGDRGFILLEFLVAFSVLTVFLAAILTGLSVAIRSDHQAAFLTRATMLARAKLAAAGVDYPLRPGTTGAELDNGYVWRADVRTFRSIAAAGRRIQGLSVEVTVSDPRSSGRRSVSLSSIEIVAGDAL
jgi:type II secretory pathway pseudopilin PulG